MSLRSEQVAQVEVILSCMVDPQRGQLLGYLERLSGARRELLGDLALLLFGSAAGGTIRPWSDVDLALVTDHFSGVPWAWRISRMGRRLSPPPLLSPIGLTHEEYETYTYPAVIRFVRGNHIRLL